MCLIGLAIGASPRFPVIVAANRDELHARPTKAAHWWEDQPRILAGRDQLAGGTWLGVTRLGRISAVTNLRQRPSDDRPSSRGLLVTDYLADSISPSAYAALVVASRDAYKPFNLILIGSSEFRYVNSEGTSVELRAGVHAFSNSPLGDDWPKTARARAGLYAALTEPDPARFLLDFLSGDPDGAATRDFTEDVFIRGDTFGTRSSTVVTISATGQLEFIEHQFDAAGQLSHRTRFCEALAPAAPV